jgi:integrase/recombinase XerD
MFVSSSREWLSHSVLSQSADAYVGYLQRHGYSAETVRVYFHSIGHFARWLTQCRVPLCRIDEALVRRFLVRHLPKCTCPPPCQRTRHEVRAALRHLLRVLRSEALIPSPEVSLPPAIDAELERFDTHLNTVCGLAPATRASRRMWLTKFLLNRFGPTPVDIEKLNPRSITNFLVQQTEGYKPGTMNVLAGTLRSYLRFRALSCGDRIESLLAAVPTTAHWRLATLPAHLQPEEVLRFLAAFNRQSATGRRGYAIARCLVDLGLRASEVAAIQLDDLDWKQGTLKIGASKSRRADVLPLPPPTGQAIADYLRHARPQNASRVLFVRHRAPFDIPAGVQIVRCTVRMAFERCGLANRGPHVLRHTAAVRMLHAGASLKEVADLLRHRSLDTTAIYTKVDLPRLAAVAAPWPGRLS